MHILHLEDDGPLREILAAALKAVEPSCEIHQFTNSDTALTYVEQHGQEIDLFILDIRVPGAKDGLQAAFRIRELKCMGALVITSAFRVPDPETLKTLNGEWFPKPWHILETSQKLLKLAQKKRSEPPTGAPPSDTPPIPPPPTTPNTQLAKTAAPLIRIMVPVPSK